MIFFKKNKEQSTISINDKSDLTITVLLLGLISLVYFYLSTRTQQMFFYYISLMWYITFLHFLLNIKWFSGLGMYVIYLLCYVQLAVMMNGFYSYYTTLDPRTINTITIYNIVSPFALIPIKKIVNISRTELKQISIQENWIRMLFLVGVFAMCVFYAWVGTIPLFANDAENFRITAISGKGFLVVIANNCFLLSMSLSKKSKNMYSYFIVGSLLLLGTGFRSQFLVLIIVFFLINVVGKGKKFILKGSVTIFLILFLYAMLGVFRSSIEYNVSRLYLPVVWRFFVNLDNYNIIIKQFPTSYYQYGKSILNDISVILPGAQETFMLQLKTILGYNFAGGSMTPSVFGEGYYNWGLFGAVAWPIFNLYFISFADRYNKRKLPSGLYYAVTFGLTNLATSSFIPPIINNYIPALLVFYTLNYFNKRYKLLLWRR